jgi:RNA polymerase sigma-70 factor (ECF subfamily)
VSLDSHSALDALPSFDLAKVQEFLRQRLAELEPDAFLTHEFDRFFHIYSQIIRNLAHRLCPVTSSVDDVVQEVWVLIYRRLPQFQWQEKGQRALHAWVWKLVRGKATDVLRCHVRHPARPMSEVVGTAREPEAEPDWSGKEIARELRRELAQQLLGELETEESAQNYRMFVDRHVQRLSVADIAAREGLTVDQVSCRLYRMLTRLRSRVALYTGDKYERPRPRRRRGKRADAEP